MAKDNTVHDQGLSLQIQQDPHRFHDVKGHGAGPRLYGWNLGRIPWASVSGTLPATTRMAG